MLCEICEKHATHVCSGFDVSELGFCSEHAVEHALFCPEIRDGKAQIFARKRRNREQLPPPVPQDVQPEGQRVGGAEEDSSSIWQLRCGGYSFRMKDYVLQRRQRSMTPWEDVGRLDQLVARKEPVAAGAPLGGAGKEELEKRLRKICWNLYGSDFWGGVYCHTEAAYQLAREAVAAERERCAQIVLNRSLRSSEMGSIIEEIRSGG